MWVAIDGQFVPFGDGDALAREPMATGQAASGAAVGEDDASASVTRSAFFFL